MSTRCHTLLTPLSSYSHLVIFISYFLGLWFELLISWLYSIGVLNFCLLFSKTSLFLLKKRFIEYFLNQSVPTNKAALDVYMTISSTGTLTSVIVRGVLLIKPITFFLAWSTIIMLLLSARFICSLSYLTIGRVMIDIDTSLLIIVLTRWLFTRIVVYITDSP